jgi:hypothetical protein
MTTDDTRDASPGELNATVAGYLECALWSSTDESDPETGGDPMDDNYSVDDIAPEVVAQAREDCAAMLALPDAGLYLAAVSDGAASHHAAEQFGHDFWLTRNRHGTGFWDRGLGDLGDG